MISTVHSDSVMKYRNLSMPIHRGAFLKSVHGDMDSQSQYATDVCLLLPVLSSDVLYWGIMLELYLVYTRIVVVFMTRFTLFPKRNPPTSHNQYNVLLTPSVKHTGTGTIGSDPTLPLLVHNR
jgi:hypothetical protein